LDSASIGAALRGEEQYEKTKEAKWSLPNTMWMILWPGFDIGGKEI
jgi:hypothetical protein